MTITRRRSLTSAGLLFAVFIALTLLACAKSEQEDKQSPSASTRESEEAKSPALMQDRRAAPRAPGDADQTARPKAKDGKQRDESDRGLQTHFLAPTDLGKERLLEYRVNLTYECKDLIKARRDLLELIGKYGFIKASTASMEPRNRYMSTSLFIKSSMLYDALKEFEVLGALLNESITVTDHTEGMVQQDRKVRREQLRLNRKGQAINQVSPGAGTWSDREASLERSENEFDNAEHARWQIRDRIAWAQVQVNLRGPEAPEYIDVPLYQNAFVGLANLLLRLLYAIIYLAPFLAAAGLIVWKWDVIRSFFRRTNK